MARTPGSGVKDRSGRAWPLLGWASCLATLLSPLPAAAQLDGVLRNLLQGAAPTPYRPPPPAYVPPPAYYAPPPGYYPPPPPYAYERPMPMAQPRAPAGAREAPGSRAAGSGKYCANRNATMLLVRRTGERLEFAINAWSGRGNLFSLTGIARPDDGGWVYEENMNAPNPSARCIAHIGGLGGGGYSFSVGADGPCIDGQGNGAAFNPGTKVLFPAASRRGAIPGNLTMAQASSMERGGLSCP